MSDGISQGYEMAREAMQETKCLLTTFIEYFSKEKYQEGILTNLERWLENERGFVNEQALNQAKDRASELKWDEESKYLPSTQSVWASLYYDLFNSEIIKYPGVFSAVQEVSPLRIKTVLTYGNISHQGNIIHVVNSKNIFRLWIDQVPQDQLELRERQHTAFLLGIDSAAKFHIVYF